MSEILRSCELFFFFFFFSSIKKKKIIAIKLIYNLDLVADGASKTDICYVLPGIKDVGALHHCSPAGCTSMVTSQTY